MLTYRKSSCVSNFFGFLGQQSQIYKPPTLEVPDFPLTVESFLRDPAGLDSVVRPYGGALRPERLLNDPPGLDWFTTILSFKESFSDCGENPDAEIRSYEETLVILLPPTDKAAEDPSEADVRELPEDRDDSDP
jgi:hypothetical protein